MDIEEIDLSANCTSITTAQRLSALRNIKRASDSGARAVKLRSMFESRAPVSLPRIRWLERPDP